MGIRNYVVVAAVLAVIAFIAADAALGAPLNDDIAFATPLWFEGSALTVNLTNATAEPDDPTCGAPIYQTVWYRYTSPVDQFIEAHLADTVGSTFLRPRLSVWTVDPGALNEVQCHPDAHAVEFQATAGGTYYFEVASPEPDGVTTLNFNVNPNAFVNPYNPVPPMNDLYWYAVEVPGIPYATTADVGAATSDPGYDPEICGIDSCYVLGDTMWYSFPAETEQEVDALFTRQFDAPYVAVFTGTLDDLQFIASSIQGKSKSGATRFTAQPGVTYSIMFASSYEHMYSLPANLAVRPAPPPTGGSVSVSPTARLYRRLVMIPDVGYSVETHVVIVVHVTCDAPLPSVAVALTVTQGLNEVVGRGTAYCATGEGDVRLDLSDARRFHNGTASVTVSASDYDANFYVSAGPTPLKIGRGQGQ